MTKDLRLSITPIHTEEFEPTFNWDDPLEVIRKELLGESFSNEDGVNCGYRHACAANPDEEGYDGIGQRTYTFESPLERFNGINSHGLQNDFFATESPKE